MAFMCILILILIVGTIDWLRTDIKAKKRRPLDAQIIAERRRIMEEHEKRMEKILESHRIQDARQREQRAAREAEYKESMRRIAEKQQNLP